MAVNRIAIPQQVAWELAETGRVPQLLVGLLGGWVAGHVEMDPTMSFIDQSPEKARQFAHTRYPGESERIVLDHENRFQNCERKWRQAEC